ncbi:MAG TPA: Rossmann-like and DUF2520 domain-containing protein [Balneolaceae bacterium]|nr:Rossmann-like and DUF2520 domain-containing protein [Balneolaceae bacterium]
MNIPDITIIGLGRLGQVLAKRLAEKDIVIKSVFNRSDGKAQELSRRLNIDISAPFPAKKDQLGRLVFLTLSDGAIEQAARQLSEIDNDFTGYTFVHCSGNEPANILSHLQKKGAAIASFHPLQSFTEQAAHSDFDNIFFSLQGDKKTFKTLMPLAKKLGSHAFEVTEEQKSQLHAAAVIASNYLISLMKVAAETGALGGLSQKQVQKALLPLIQKTLQNANQQSLGKALTGPIARGDIKTVKKHIKLLDKQSHLLNIYVVLGAEAVKLAQSNGSIDTDQAARLHEVLDGSAAERRNE